MEARPVYPIGAERNYSIFDLLNNFANADYNDGQVSRLSDMHVKVGEVINFRVDSQLSPIEDGARCDAEMVKGLLYPILDSDKIALLEENPTQDVDAGYYWEKRNMAFRINAFRDREGLAFVVRMLPQQIPDLGTLGFPKDTVWKEIANLSQGLVLISGVTGSGKSTTMNSIVQKISESRSCRVITLEDPIEYIHPSSNSIISQREVGMHVDSFSGGLKSALRENPDFILVGEMRDPETISLAMTAAETGHLVLSTIHTRDVTGAITRILDSFPPEKQNNVATQMSFSLVYIIAQKLVPRLDGSGRVPAMEILRINNSVANQIRQKNLSQIYSSMETRSDEGMNTLEAHLSSLYHEGAISQEDAEYYANDMKCLNL
ncbi:MAG: type IV pilus twitching motility protein PilT [Opitutales bacterium]